jgi:hypothetical protein
VEREVLKFGQCAPKWEKLLAYPLLSLSDSIAVASLGGEQQHYLAHYACCGVLTAAVFASTLIIAGIAITAPPAIEIMHSLGRVNHMATTTPTAIP